MKKKYPFEKTHITVAGVMRCCIRTVGEEYEDGDVEVGAQSACKYCKEPFTLVWEDRKPVWKPDWQFKADKE